MAFCRYAECHLKALYAECRYAECHGAVLVPIRLKFKYNLK